MMFSGKCREDAGAAREWIPYPRYLLRKNLVKRILAVECMEGKKCLEIGYGAGEMLLLYAERGCSVHAFDLSEVAFASAQRRIAGHPVLARHIALCKREAEIEEGKYDYLMAFEVLEHIEDDVATLIK